MENIMNTIKMLRQKYEYTQEELAKKINVSKATVIAYEKDSSNIPAATVASIAKLFDVDCDCIIHNTQPKSYTYNEIKEQNESLLKDNIERIDIPQNNIKKFKEVLLYITGKIGAKPNVGQTVLYKILYFIDFDYYELFEEQLIGARYIKNHFGPTPVDFLKITREMEEENTLSIMTDTYFNKKQTKYLPRKEADLSLFSARELQHIDNCLIRYGDKNAKELSNYSHKDVPWIIAENGEPLEYESVFYRTPDTSVRTYNED
mgnify:FL=1